MKSSYCWLAGACVIGVVAAFGCGGAEAGDGSAAGASAGASGGSAGNGSQGGSANQGAGEANSAGEASGIDCSPQECGPQLGLPNYTCEDGTTGGPTGRCLKTGDACGWEVRDCVPAGQGGASQGGQGNDAGAPGAGGAVADACGGCDVPDEICVYQVGGPGSVRFTCAAQNPCGAPGACACIVDQGQCQDTLMGDPPSYCVCDNGLD